MPNVLSTAVVPRQADRVAILVNPKAGPSSSQPLVDALAWQLCREGMKVEMFSQLDAALAQANRWHEHGCLRTIVAAGGDGTAAAVVNGTADGVPITLCPAGNSNLLAGYFGLNKDPAALCRTICEGTIARVDAGLANGRIFLLMAGCGFDAEVVRRVHGGRRGHVSNLSYVKPILQTFCRYHYPEIRVHWEDGDGQTDPEPWLVRWLFAFNLPCYAGGLQMAPQAHGADGQFDVWGFRRGGLFVGMWYLAAVLARKHHQLTDYTVRHATRLRLTSDVEVPYQLDGDPGGVLPLELQILPGRVTLMVPKTAVQVVSPG